MENFLLPSKIDFEAGENPFSGTITITPCYHGYGTTLGNALRRVLLSSLPGAAVEYFKIKGVQHEFTTLEGVKEDGVEMMLNVKQLAVKVFSEEPVLLMVSKKGPGPVTAGDIEKNAAVEVVNKDLVLCTLTKNIKFEMEIVVNRGRGYTPVEEKDRQNYDLGTIVVDSVYTPVKDVGYHVEYTRVGDVTNYEKLVLNVETNGTISPRSAIQQATQILMDHFTIILSGAEKSVASAEPPALESAGEPMVGEEAAAMGSAANEELTLAETDTITEKKSKAKKKAKKKE